MNPIIAKAVAGFTARVPADQSSGVIAFPHRPERGSRVLRRREARARWFRSRSQRLCIAVGNLDRRVEINSVEVPLIT